MTRIQMQTAEYLLRCISQGQDSFALRLQATQFARTFPPKERERVEAILRNEAAVKNKWRRMTLGRHPCYPASVESELLQWLREARAWELLAENGERVMPLLLVGEPGCGKSSLVRDIANSIEAPAWMMMGADVVASHMGATGANLREAFREVDQGLFLIDEFEAIAGVRETGSGAEKEMASALTILIDCLDNILPGSVMVFATNRVDMIDPAILRRVAVCKWPAWTELTEEERASFAASHKGSGNFASYADCVRGCRLQRISKLLAD